MSKKFTMEEAILEEYWFDDKHYVIREGLFGTDVVVNNKALADKILNFLNGEAKNG